MVLPTPGTAWWLDNKQNITPLTFDPDGNPHAVILYQANVPIYKFFWTTTVRHGPKTSHKLEGRCKIAKNISYVILRYMQFIDSYDFEINAKYADKLLEDCHDALKSKILDLMYKDSIRVCRKSEGNYL